jgi:hypothetical protein
MAKNKAVSAESVAYNISGIRHLRVVIAGDKIRWLRFEGGRRYVEVINDNLTEEYEKIHKEASSNPGVEETAPVAEGVKAISKIEIGVADEVAVEEEVGEVAEEEVEEEVEAEEEESEEPTD